MSNLDWTNQFWGYQWKPQQTSPFSSPARPTDNWIKDHKHTWKPGDWSKINARDIEWLEDYIWKWGSFSIERDFILGEDISDESAVFVKPDWKVYAADKTLITSNLFSGSVNDIKILWDWIFVRTNWTYAWNTVNSLAKFNRSYQLIWDYSSISIWTDTDINFRLKTDTTWDLCMCFLSWGWWYSSTSIAKNVDTQDKSLTNIWATWDMYAYDFLVLKHPSNSWETLYMWRKPISFTVNMKVLAWAINETFNWWPNSDTQSCQMWIEDEATWNVYVVKYTTNFWFSTTYTSQIVKYTNTAWVFSAWTWLKAVSDWAETVWHKWLIMTFDWKFLVNESWTLKRLKFSWSVLVDDATFTTTAIWSWFTKIKQLDDWKFLVCCWAMLKRFNIDWTVDTTFSANSFNWNVLAFDIEWDMLIVWWAFTTINWITQYRIVKLSYNWVYSWEFRIIENRWLAVWVLPIWWLAWETRTVSLLWSFVASSWKTPWSIQYIQEDAIVSETITSFRIWYALAENQYLLSKIV